MPGLQVQGVFSKGTTGPSVLYMYYSKAAPNGMRKKGGIRPHIGSLCMDKTCHPSGIPTLTDKGTHYTTIDKQWKQYHSN